MVKVKTSEGEIECPELNEIGPRTKYWASVIRDVIRTEEMYHVMGAALKEAFEAGRIEALKELMFNLGRRGEVIDAEFEVVGSGGPEHTEPAAEDQGGGPVEPAPASAELPGGVSEMPGCDCGNAEKVEEGPWHVK